MNILKFFDEFSIFHMVYDWNFIKKKESVPTATGRFRSNAFRYEITQKCLTLGEVGLLSKYFSFNS